MSEGCYPKRGTIGNGSLAGGVGELAIREPKVGQCHGSPSALADAVGGTTELAFGIHATRSRSHACKPQLPGGSRSYCSRSLDRMGSPEQTLGSSNTLPAWQQPTAVIEIASSKNPPSKQTRPSSPSDARPSTAKQQKQQDDDHRCLCTIQTHVNQTTFSNVVEQ